MNLFQTGHTFQPFSEYLENKYSIEKSDYSFKDFQQMILDEGYLGVHLLSPVYDLNHSSAIFTIWNFKPMQLAWARERGWNECDLKKIVLAQLEEYKPDVFYNLSPILFSTDELQQVKKNIVKLAWFASAERNSIDFSQYNARLTNLPSDFDPDGKRHFRSMPFQLSIPVFKEIDSIQNDKFDISFFGQYQSDYFIKRNSLLQYLVKIANKHELRISIALMSQKRFRYIFPFRLPLALHEKFKYQVFPQSLISKNSVPPLFGNEIYRQMLQSSIVFNCHGDNAGRHRVNMRIFESLGCSRHMLSDNGVYPDGLKPGHHFSVYNDATDLEEKILYLLQHKNERQKIAESGHAVLKKYFSKEIQWQQFQKIVAEVS